MTDSPPLLATPDPTFRTTEQVEREIAHLKELMLARLASMDKAVELLQAIANRSPTVNEVFLQHEQKFVSFALQFSERDVRAEQYAIQTKVAIDAALQAAKEAVGKQQEASDRAIAKSEIAITKQMDQLSVIMATSNKATDEKIDDLKARLSGMDGRERGLDKGREPLNALWMILAAALVGAVVTYFVSRGTVGP